MSMTNRPPTPLDGFRLLTGREGAPDYPAIVQALLDGTTGWAFNPKDASRAFTDTLATTPVANAGDPVARFNSYWGTTVWNWQNPTLAQQALWQGTHFEFDGNDDFYAATETWSQNMAAATHTEYIMQDDFAAPRHLLGLGVASFSTRWQEAINSDGSITFNCRRLDADVGVAITSAAGVVQNGIPCTLQFQADYAGTGAIRVLKDGTVVASGVLNGTPGNSQNSASTRSRIGRINTNTTTGLFRKRMGVNVWAQAYLSDDDLASMRGYVEGVGL